MTTVIFGYTFDPGPGEQTTFPAPTATATVPVGTVSNYAEAAGSGPLDIWQHDPYTGPVQGDGSLITVPLPDMPGGTTLTLEFSHSATNAPGETESIGTLTSGAFTASKTLRANVAQVDYDDPANNRVDGDWEDPARAREALQEGRLYYEWIEPAYRRFDETLGRSVPGPALDEDYFLVDPPAPGERLVISTNATDGQLALALFSASALAGDLGVSNAGAAPGTAVTEQSGSGGEAAEAGGDAAAPFAGHTLVDQASVGGDGTAMVEAASTDAEATAQMMLRVTSGNGLASSSLYSLRATYIDEPAEIVCTPRTPLEPEPSRGDERSDHATPRTRSTSSTASGSTTPTGPVGPMRCARAWGRSTARATSAPEPSTAPCSRSTPMRPCAPRAASWIRTPAR